MTWTEYLSAWASRRAWEWRWDPKCEARIRRLVREVGESNSACYGYDSRVGLALRWHLGQ